LLGFGGTGEFLRHMVGSIALAENGRNKNADYLIKAGNKK
jgi:hypothetical protein